MKAMLWASRKAAHLNRPSECRHGEWAIFSNLKCKESIMKTSTAIALFSLTLLTAPAWAYHQDGSDLEQSITNVHDNHFPHTAGDSHEAERGNGDTYGSILLDIQAGERHVPHQDGDSHAPEKGKGDAYGSVLNN